MSGLFIVLEGIDGSGTSTQGQKLVELLRSQGRKVHLTCEPSRGPIGQLIRSILEKRLLEEGEVRSFDAPTMALLFAADRMDHITNEVKVQLRSGSIVICDRYLLSSLIYQSLTAEPNSLPSQQNWLRQINQGALQPDLTLVLDLKAERAAERRSIRGGVEELYEKSELQRKLAVLYAQAPQLLPEQAVYLIDAAQPVEQVTADLREKIEPLLGPLR